VPHAVTDRLIDEPGTAEVLGVSRRSVRRLAQQGTLERVKILGATRYRLSDVLRLIGTPPPADGRLSSSAGNLSSRGV
jgi:excisionase family DNA binding protein